MTKNKNCSLEKLYNNIRAKPDKFDNLATKKIRKVLFTTMTDKIKQLTDIKLSTAI